MQSHNESVFKSLYMLRGPWNKSLAMKKRPVSLARLTKSHTDVANLAVTQTPNGAFILSMRRNRSVFEAQFM